jgi:hypothetical protein
MTSITIVIGSAGFPTHAALQLNEPGTTTYFGFGPVRMSPKDTAQYDVVGPLLTGQSPVGLSNGTREFEYVAADHYNVTSCTIDNPAGQGNPADVIQAASNQYIQDHPNYDFSEGEICADYALYLAQSLIPGSDLSQISRLPGILNQQLAEIAQT